MMKGRLYDMLLAGMEAPGLIKNPISMNSNERSSSTTLPYSLVLGHGYMMSKRASLY